MNEKITVGVVGNGFVGSAVANGFRDQNVVVIDPKLGTKIQDLIDAKPEVAFICVPTPMGEDGVIDASIVRSVIAEMAPFLPNTLLVLKSTVVPDIVDSLAKTYKNFIYNPEFLTEANAKLDFERPFMHVFGGEEENCKQLQHIYENHSVCLPCTVKIMTAKEASCVKYAINSYLATKVAFWNEMEQLIVKIGADYNTVREAFTTDPRIGTSHSMVPGPDGRKGFGGSCFVKDTHALLNFGKGELQILKSAWNVNCDLRAQYPELLERETAQHVTFNKIG